MFAGLRHDALVGGDDEQGCINAAHSGEHVLDKAFVAGHIDDADLAAAGQFEPGKAEVYGHATFFFFRQAIGVDAR